jgi:hypothetical protein
MSPDEDVLDRLDRLITLLSIGFAEQVERVRTELRADPVSSAILDRVRDDWIGSGEVKRVVSRSTKVSEKAVQRSLAAMVARGLIRVHGSGATTSYRSAGVL